LGRKWQLADEAYAGAQKLASGTSDFNQLDFVVRSILSEQATAMLVLVKAVNNTGGVEPVGLVDVQPMVAQLDGKGQPTPHGTINNVPYFRLQGGVNAVIMDPVVGDIGLAVFASHDISSVKNNKAPANPGSRRRFDWADGLYLGGFLNGTPERYIRFDSSGDVWIKPASKVTVEGDLDCTGTITADVDVLADGVSLHNHTHGGVDPGAGNTAAPN
jgi:hypothetical protein